MKNIFNLRWCFLLFVILLLIFCLCLIAIIKFPGLAESFHLPFAFSLLALDLSFIAFMVLILKKVWQVTARTTRYASLVFLVIALLYIEMNGHLSKDTHAFFTYHRDSKFDLLPLDSIIDYHTMICDSYGVNRYNIHSNSPHLPKIINSDGFHSPYPFTSRTIDSAHARGEKVLLFVGDSYTYGCIDAGKCYTELMDSLPEYLALNGGILGTDPVQYECVIRELLEAKKLKPDLTVVCICGANDINGDVQRIPTPGTPLYFETNAGAAIVSRVIFDTIDYPKTARQAYASAISPLDVFDQWGNSAQFVNHSALAYVLWQSAAAVSLPTYLLFNKIAYLNLIGTLVHSDEYLGIKTPLQNMQKLCSTVGIPVVFILIPGSKQIRNGSPQIPGVISLNSKVLSAQDYPDWGNDHPDSVGNRKIFYQLRKIVDDALRAPAPPHL